MAGVDPRQRGPRGVAGGLGRGPPGPVRGGPVLGAVVGGAVEGPKYDFWLPRASGQPLMSRPGLRLSGESLGQQVRFGE